MAVDFVAKAGEAVGILAEHSIKVERGAVWVDDTVPDDLKAVLTVSELRVIFSDQARTLRNQNVAAVAVSYTFDVTSALTSPGRSELRLCSITAGIS